MAKLIQKKNRYKITTKSRFPKGVWVYNTKIQAAQGNILRPTTSCTLQVRNGSKQQNNSVLLHWKTVSKRSLNSNDN